MTASRSLRILLAKRDGQAAAGPHGDVLVHLDVGEHLAPERRQVVVDDGDRRQTGVDHLEHVVVFEHVRGLVDDHRGLAARLQLRVQRDEALLVDAPLTDEHLLASQIVDRGDGRRTWSGDDDLADVGSSRDREGDEFLPLRGDGHHGRDHVDLA